MAKGKSVVNTTDSNTLLVADLLSSSSITTTKLHGKNYLQWAAAIKTLQSSEKMKYIEEEVPEAASSEWVKEDAQVRSWLLDSMEPNVACDAMLLPSAHAIWNFVRETFTSDGNIQRIYELYEEIFLTKQGTKNLNEL